MITLREDGDDGGDDGEDADGEDDVEEGCESRQDKQPLVGNAETSREPYRASGNYKPAFIEVVIV